MTYVPKALRADWQTVGGLSSPSKMPCHGYSFPAKACRVGSKLAEVEGSVCHGCYALKGFYVMPNVERALRRRLASWEDNPAAWEEAMVRLIAHFGARDGGYFRWHDSGDVQSLGHLEAIARIAAATPNIKHWLPTREASIVAWFLQRHGRFPGNLTVRVSDPMVDRPQPNPMRAGGVLQSGVHSPGTKPDGAFSCIAYQQDGECRKCRACWSPNLDRVSYPKH